MSADKAVFPKFPVPVVQCCREWGMTFSSLSRRWRAKMVLRQERSWKLSGVM